MGDDLRRAMYAILEESFENTSWAGFNRDLDEKQWVLLLSHAATGRPVGFSTLQRLEARVDGRPIVALFSGDTILRRDSWGDTALPRAWGQLAFDLAAAEGDVPVYWFLISSGYKTYRFLPVFFREFFPHWERTTPEPVRRTIDVLGERKFGEQYDPRTGIVRFHDPAPLRPGIADTTAERMRDPAVSFFQRANPGHAGGDELACLARIDRDNLTRAGHRMLESPAWEP